eukprot:355483-Chlamydomonas_euryale.AAC.1
MQQGVPLVTYPLVHRSVCTCDSAASRRCHLPLPLREWCPLITPPLPLCVWCPLITQPLPLRVWCPLITQPLPLRMWCPQEQSRLRMSRRQSTTSLAMCLRTLAHSVQERCARKRRLRDHSVQGRQANGQSLLCPGKVCMPAQGRAPWKEAWLDVWMVERVGRVGRMVERVGRVGRRGRCQSCSSSMHGHARCQPSC